MLHGGTEAAAEKFTDLYYDRLRKLTAAAWRIAARRPHFVGTAAGYCRYHHEVGSRWP
ncbi:MAG: hypothetical protein ACRETZ_00230 [Steroidobacteraceae bacterium]